MTIGKSYCILHTVQAIIRSTYEAGTLLRGKHVGAVGEADRGRHRCNQTVGLSWITINHNQEGIDLEICL